MKTIRMIHSDDLRITCIKNKWYTRGNSEEYARLLNMANGELTDDLLAVIILDIYHHSNWDTWDDCTITEIIENIGFQILNNTVVYIVEWEVEE